MQKTQFHIWKWWIFVKTFLWNKTVTVMCINDICQCECKLHVLHIFYVNLQQKPVNTTFSHDYCVKPPFFTFEFGTKKAWPSHVPNWQMKRDLHVFMWILNKSANIKCIFFRKSVLNSHVTHILHVIREYLELKHVRHVEINISHFQTWTNNRKMYFSHIRLNIF